MILNNIHLFWLLILAHFLADFPLQTNFIFKLKTKGSLGLVLHGLIFFMTALVLCWGYLQNVWLVLFIIFLAATHIFEDSFKLRLIDTKGRDNLWLFFLDQFVHIVFICIIFILPQTRENNIFLPKMLSFLIISTYAGSVLIYYVRKTFFNKKEMFQRDYLGMLERLIIFLLFLADAPYIIFIPIIIVIYILLESYFAGHRRFRFDIITLVTSITSSLWGLLWGLML